MTQATLAKRDYKKVIDKLHKEQAKALLFMSDFPLFYRNVYSRVIPNFVWGDHIEDFATRLQFKHATATVGARGHAKSETLYAKIIWRIFRLPYESFEMFYISSNETLASYHIGKARQAFEVLSDMGLFDDYQLVTDSRLSIQLRHRPSRHVFSCKPKGINSNMRGIHADEVICDDLMGSEQQVNQRISLNEIEQVKHTFLNVIHPIPRWSKNDAQLHVAGNAVDPEDVLLSLKDSEEFDWIEYPAIMGGTPPSYEDGRVLWPEMYSMEKLQAIRRGMTDMPFARQFMCIPARRTEAFLTQEDIDAAIIPEELDGYVASLTAPSYAMLDVGKIRHPSHITILTPDANGILWQRDLREVIGSPFLRGVEYLDQINICKMLIDKFNIVFFYYDATRGEFAVPAEQGLLPSQMEPLSLVHQNQGKVAHALRYAIRHKVEWVNPVTGENEISPRLRVQPDSQQVRQMLDVDEMLDSPDRRGDHADSFWSLAGATYAARRVGKSSYIPSGSSGDGSGSGFGNLFDMDFADIFKDMGEIWQT